MSYYDNFWHIGAHDNIPSPACLIVFLKKLRTSLSDLLLLT